MNKWEKEVQASLLKDEKEVIKALKKCYEAALEECNHKIADFMLRIQTGDNVQAAIYQKQYQEALKGQIEAALQKLHTENFTTIQDYLNSCYENGYMGALYNIQNQGIPLIMPIDQEQMIKAITTNSKISEGLYKRLGIDTKQLKKIIIGQVSRGISTGSSWQEIARNIRNSSGVSFNNAVRIARTEGHRIQQESALDACVNAKSMGADVVKQWDSTMDSRTRESHARLDGQIRELDEDFEIDGKKASAPGHFGDPSEDCNCRCCILQRARWALDESELRTLQERAAYFGIDKAKDFEDYKKKYVNAVDKMAESGIMNSRTTSGALNPYSKRAEEHAIRYYESVRHMKTDIYKISKATGIATDKIEKIKNHIFIKEHDLIDGHRRFDPSYYIAESWQRLINGNFEEKDIVLLKHEYAEILYMNKGMSQNEAHIKASKLYNYAKYCE